MDFGHKNQYGVSRYVILRSSGSSVTWGMKTNAHHRPSETDPQGNPHIALDHSMSSPDVQTGSVYLKTPRDYRVRWKAEGGGINTDGRTLRHIWVKSPPG